MDSLLIIFNIQILTVYITEKNWAQLNEAKMVGEELCQGKIDYKTVVYSMDCFQHQN